jgi:hypothetical protein
MSANRERREAAMLRGMTERAMNETTRAIGATAVQYAAELCRLSCAPLLIPLFPNFKEVTESFAAYHAVMTHLPEYGRGDTDVTVLCVGDGSTPRTGATFALRTAWRAVSVDPNLNTGRRNSRMIRRLELDPRRVEETRTVGKRVIVVAVHSHADLGAAVATVDAQRVAAVALPCCVPQRLGAPPDVQYEDYGCLSPQRAVMVWRDARRLAS